MSALTERPIHIREIDDYGIPHPPMFGRFDSVELTFVIATLPSGKARSWSREPRESAEIFAGRIVRDVIESVRGTACVLLTA